MVSFSCSIGLLVGAIISILVTWYLVHKRDLAGKTHLVVPEIPVTDEAMVVGEKK